MAILFERRGRVAVVTINRPDAMNAIDPETNAELESAWQDFERDPELLVGVLTGAGDRAFSAGADLKTLIPLQREQARRREAPEWNFGGITRGARSSKPIVAAVNGHCLAGGLEMALACDIRLCSPNATFGLAEVRWAIIPGAGGTQRLPRAVPLGLALEMILSGNSIDAGEALRVGLVNRVVPLPDLVSEAVRLAETIASRGPLAVRAAKRAVLEGLNLGIEAGLELEAELFEQLMHTEDAVEGPRAFAEKRPPRFRGA